MTSEERLKELALFSLEECSEIYDTSIQICKRWLQWATCSPEAIWEMIRNIKLEGQQGRFRLDIRKNIFNVRIEKHWEAGENCVRLPVSPVRPAFPKNGSRQVTSVQEQQMGLNDQGKAFPVVSSRFLGQHRTKEGREGGRFVTCWCPCKTPVAGVSMEAEAVHMHLLVILPSGWTGHLYLWEEDPQPISHWLYPG